jgi:hypothetical protein
MHAQRIVSRLHIHRNPQVALSTKKWNQVQSFVFALGYRQMGIYRPKVNYMPIPARGLGFQSTGRNPRCRVCNFPNRTLLQHFRKEFRFPVENFFRRPYWVRITERRWCCAERKGNTLINPLQKQWWCPCFCPKVTVVAHHSLEAMWLPLAHWGSLKIWAPVSRLVAKIILSCSDNCLLALKLSPLLGLSKNTFSTHSLGNS